MKASKTAIWGLGILAAVCLAPDASAQTVGKDMREKSRWYHAAPEYQLIDDRPIIKDFREAPSAPGSIQLPPPPQGFGGPGGGGQGGAMGDGGGVMPAGGIPLPMGAGDMPYRTALPGMGSRPLEQSGFGRHTNIPAGGMGPKVALPNGQSTGVHGSLMTPTVRQAAPGAAAGNRAAMQPVAQRSTPAASYGGNYAQPTGGYSGSGSGASTAVRGVLLNRLKN